MPALTLMKKYKDPKIAIKDTLKRINVELDSYDDFIEYCEKRGLFDDAPLRNNSFTRKNIIKLYKEFIYPIRQVSAILNLTYKELAEKIGYKEPTLISSAKKTKINNHLKKALELLLKNYELQKELEKQKISFNLAVKAMCN